MRRLPPLGSIQGFVEVARLGSVKAAADSLALSSPALTRRIQSLEQFVGSPLFERQPKGVHLNARGEAFLTEVRPHLDALARAVERAFDDPKSMRLRIAAPSLFAQQRLLPAMPSLRKQHPGLMIDIDTATDPIPRLGDGIDAAISLTRPVDKGIYARALERGRIIAVGARRFTEGGTALRRPEDLQGMPILLHRQMVEAFDIWRNAIGRPALEPAHVSYFDAGNLILDAAAEGLGIAFVFESHLACSADPRLAQIFSESAESPYGYWFVCPPSALERRGVKLFHDWLQALCSPENPDQSESAREFLDVATLRKA